jgi:hypothetical protein
LVSNKFALFETKQLYYADFEMWSPGALSETKKKFAQLQENVKFWYGMLDKDLSVEDSAELRDAFELDKQKDLKKQATKGNWLCKTGDENNKELLREIHEHAIKVQSKIAKGLEK